MDKNIIIDYIKELNQGELAYQYQDGLINFIGGSGDEISIQDEKEMLATDIDNASIIELVSTNDLKKSGVNDIANWANDCDCLVYVNQSLVLCIPSCDKWRVA